MLTISSLSTVQVRIETDMQTSTGLGNPSADTVQLAFLATTANPQNSDWKAGTWEQTPAGGWVAQCLVGPNGVVTLPPGQYYIWRKITDPVETPVECVGMLEVT